RKRYISRVLILTSIRRTAPRAQFENLGNLRHGAQDSLTCAAKIPLFNSMALEGLCHSVAIALKEYEAVARGLKIDLQSLGVRVPNPDFDGALQAAAKERAGALITITGTLLARNAKPIADLAIKNRLPSMYERNHYVEAGGLMSYSSDNSESFRRATIYVDKIL